MSSGKLIMLSGIECSGKDTQIALLEQELVKRGIPVQTAREPGGTSIGEQIRAIFKDPAHAKMITPLTSLLFINAARSQLFHEVVKPTLDAGINLLINRSLLCTIAYQAWAEGLPLQLVRSLSWEAMHGITPKKIFILDISVETMRERLAKRGGAEQDRYDSKPLDFHKQVREGYLTEAKCYDHFTKVINGERTPEEVFHDLLNQTLSTLTTTN